ncbi:MAG: cytochrome c peroxidase [Bacteroidota bacterium]
MSKRFEWLLILLFGLLACKQEAPVMVMTSVELEIPEGFPEMEIPENNALTEERIALGKKLFFDPSLSRDRTISCASCHLQSLAFTDGVSRSIGINQRLSLRNSPTLANVGFHPYFFAEGGSPTLELQVIGPIENPDEMDFTARELEDRLVMDEEYNRLAQEAYGRPMSMWVLVRAIASFERTMISGNSPYDFYLREGKSTLFSEQAKRGMELFFDDRLNCAQCHPAPLFTDFSLQNIGLTGYEEDAGRFRVTLDSADIGKFKTPTLRNIALTAPYMHDGRFETLDQVLDFFDRGGSGHFNQSEWVRPLGLTESEKKALKAFMEALTDDDFINQTSFQSK